MTPEKFLLLNTGDQERVVHHLGAFIAIRQEPEFVIRLYQLDSFYVELYFHQVSKAPVAIRSFTDPLGLEPYLSGMDLCFD